MVSRHSRAQNKNTLPPQQPGPELGHQQEYRNCPSPVMSSTKYLQSPAGACTDGERLLRGPPVGPRLSTRVGEAGGSATRGMLLLVG